MTENRAKRVRRVILAVTESSRVSDLWRIAMRSLEEPQAEFIALFLHDERWHRAASLPFTREISKAGGGSTDFTSQRAEQLFSETVARMREDIDALAVEAGVKIDFEALPEADLARTRWIVEGEEIVIVAPAEMTRHPVLTELERFNLRIFFVEPDSAHSSPIGG